MTHNPASGRRLSACVVNYQGAKCIGATLEALADSAGLIDELLVVDSASTDGSRELVRLSFPDARIIELKENRGPGVARNRGFAEAASDLMLFVDNDVVVQPGCVDRLVGALDEAEDVAVTLPSVRLAASPATVQFEGADPHFLGLMALRNQGMAVPEVERPAFPVGSMVSACFALHKGRWGDDPPFDESFGFNYEDHDFGVRCSVLGLRIVVVPSAVCLHGEGTPGLSVRRGERSSPERAYHLMRGRWVVLLKTFELRTLVVLSPALFGYECFLLAFAVRRGLIRQWIRAGGKVFAHLPELRRDRRAVQTRRNVWDRDLLIGGPLPLRSEATQTRLERICMGFLQRLFALYWKVVRHVV